MTRPFRNFKPLLLGVIVSGASLTAAAASFAETLDELYARLRDPALPNWQAVEDEIWQEWSKSGSPSMDLLLQRGRDAIEAGELDAAQEHLTALTDHAPDFAEGWNARATAYFQAGKIGPSVDAIAHTLALNPKHFGALSGLAMILDETGRPRQALAAYQAVNDMNPHRQDVKDAIRRLEQQLGDRDL